MSAGSIQTTSSASTFQTPLSHVVNCNNTETILVTDSVRCDGRFVLYTIGAAVLNQNRKSSVSQSFSVATSTKKSESTKSRVLWISCTSMTNELIVHALKKIGLQRDVISSMSHSGPTNEFYTSERLCIHSIVSSIAEATIIPVDDVTFVKGLHRHILDFVSKQDNRSMKDPTIVIFDDISALSVLFGERLAYSLIFSLSSLKLSATHPFGLVVRCSNDWDIDTSGLSITNHVESCDPSTARNVPWERSLVELADSIIDVALLPSGYSRDVHGRLTLSGRSADTSSTGTFNFCLTDNQVLLKRLVT